MSCDQCYTISNAINVRLVETSRDQMLYHFERNVKSEETPRDRWHQLVSKICLCKMKMKFCLERSTFSFGLSQKLNNNTPQSKRFLNFNIFCRTFTTF